MVAKTPETLLCVSYFPFISDVVREHGLDVAHDQDTLESKINAIIDNMGRFEIHGCAWTLNDTGAAVPVLVVRHAKKLAADLEIWSSDNVGDWFTIQIALYDTYYMIGVWPNLKKSVERFKLRLGLLHRHPVDDDAEIKVMFEPIVVNCPSVNTLSQIKDKLPSRGLFGLVDIGDVVLTAQIPFRPQDVVELGPIDYEVNSDEFLGYCKSWVEGNDFDSLTAANEAKSSNCKSLGEAEPWKP